MGCCQLVKSPRIQHQSHFAHFLIYTLFSSQCGEISHFGSVKAFAVLQYTITEKYIYIYGENVILTVSFVLFCHYKEEKVESVGCFYTPDAPGTFSFPLRASKRSLKRVLSL